LLRHLQVYCIPRSGFLNDRDLVHMIDIHLKGEKFSVTEIGVSVEVAKDGHRHRSLQNLSRAEVCALFVG